MKPAVFTPLCLSLLALMLALSPLFPKPVLPGAASLIAALSLVFLWPQRAQIKFSKRFLILSVGTILIVAASALWAVMPMAALGAAAKLAGLFMAGSMIIAALRQAPLPEARAQLIIPVGLMIGMGLAIFLLATDMSLYHWWTPNVPHNTAPLNKTCIILTAFFPVAWVMLRYQSYKWPARAGIAATWCAMVALSQGQSALLAGLIMGVIWAVPNTWEKLWRILRVAVVGGVILAPWIAMTGFTHFADQIGDRGILRAANTAQRLEVWNAIAHKIMERPVLGYGYDATRYLVFDSAQIYERSNTFLHPHNMALQFWIEYGAVGAVLGALALLLIMRRIDGLADARIRRLYRVSFYALLSVALVGWGMWQMWWIVLVVLLIGNVNLSARLMNADQYHAAAKSNIPPATSSHRPAPPRPRHTPKTHRRARHP